MIIHEIHDLTNNRITDLLKQGLSNIKDKQYITNYHPDYATDTGNLFYILEHGRYINGKYYVLEEDGKFVCSGGWNEYEPDIALMLTRLYIAPEHRAKYYAGNYILPKALEEAKGYKHIWITCNEYNKSIYHWFDRANKGKRTGLFNDWPNIYKKFVPIGKKEIYYTEQYIAEYRHND